MLKSGRVRLGSSLIQLLKIITNCRFVVVDGNEKVYRLICAAEKTKVTGKYGQPSRYDNICVRDPMRGNQHVAPSKYCQQHQQGNNRIYVVTLPAGGLCCNLKRVCVCGGGGEENIFENWIPGRPGGYFCRFCF